MVDLQPHCPAWADDYRREAERLAVALGTRVDALEHIGSTAVPRPRRQADRRRSILEA
jgi:GrpB-like predicted nucleotidyltransferase (UPF0157 family)